MVIICQNKNIQLLRLPVSEVNCSDSAKRAVKLSEFRFYCVDVFHHQFNDIYRLMGILSDKEFSCHF